MTRLQLSKIPQLSILPKLVLSVATVGTLAGATIVGTMGTFQGSAAKDQSFSSATVTVALGANGGADGDANNRLTIGATALVPGDSIQRRVRLRNTGTADLASASLTTTAVPSNALTTDGTDGLQVKIQKCAGALGWAESGAPYVYTCDETVPGDDAGVRTSVLAVGAIIRSAAALSNLSSLTAGSSDDLVVTETFPSTAGTALQGLSAAVTFTFTGTQRAGTNR